MTKQTTYSPVIGLEVHAELTTASKMFCGCQNDPFGADKPNIYTCPVCLGMPGALPVANKKAIEWTIKLGLALHCKINLFSKFDRKHYFYPDLPKGYQISQYDIPFCYDGYLDTSQGRVGITRIHLEEDTGKLLHKIVESKKVSLVDFNRSGVPLTEIVTEPEIHSAAQAKECGKKLRQIMKFLEIADCDMEQGGMRLEANISIRPTGSQQLPNYKVEIKNINSFRFMEQAITYEVQRHSLLLEQGETPKQETRGWDVKKNQTFLQRYKEESADYRYFPDPDIPPIQFTKAQIEQIKKEMPELPTERISRWVEDYGLELRFAQQLVLDKKESDWLETVFIQGEENKVDANQIAKSLINKKIKVNVGDNPQAVIDKIKQLYQTDSIDQAELEKIIKEVLAENPDAVTKLKAGKKQVVGFLMGQVMMKLSKKVDPKLVQQTLSKLVLST